MSEWKSEAINEIATALNKAQALLQPAIKDRKNPAFPNSKYADLASVMEAIGPALEASKLSVAQIVMPVPDRLDDEGTNWGGNAMILRTLLMHPSGQWIASDLPLRPDFAKPQAVGSALTYARRYGLSAMLGVYQDDDDAEAAMGRPAAPQGRHTPAPEPKQDSKPFVQFIEDAAKWGGVDPGTIINDVMDSLIQDGIVVDGVRDLSEKTRIVSDGYKQDHDHVAKLIRDLSVWYRKSNKAKAADLAPAAA